MPRRSRDVQGVARVADRCNRWCVQCAIKDLGSDLVLYCSSSRRLPTIGRVKAMGAMIVLIDATPISAEPSAASIVPV